MSEDYFQAMYQIITTGHWITDEVGRALKEFETTEPQYNVLRMLSAAQSKPLTVGELADGMVQRSSNVTRIIDKLLSKGLVTRQECPSNRRKMDISITTSGKQFLKKLDQKVQAMHKPLMNNLTEKELKQLQKLIKKFKGEKND